MRELPLVLVLIVGALRPAAAGAQSTAPIPGRFELALGASWTGAASLGSADANETTGGGGTFSLFSTNTRLDAATGIDGRIGIPLWRSLRVEASGSYATPQLSTRISADAEDIPDVTAPETVTQFTAEGGIVAELLRWRLGSRGVPFAAVGAGYLRQLHERRTLAETGTIYHLGGGVNYVIARRTAARLKSAGIRVDLRALLRTGGVSFDDDAVHVTPAIRTSVFVRF